MTTDPPSLAANHTNSPGRALLAFPGWPGAGVSPAAALGTKAQGFSGGPARLCLLGPGPCETGSRVGLLHPFIYNDQKLVGLGITLLLFRGV